jgi:hypothetical protein
MSLLYGSLSKLPAPSAAPTVVLTLPSITAGSKEIGVVMTRVVGVYATGWAPTAGRWTINGTETELGTAATCSSSSIPVGGYALYRETISKAGEADQFAFSLPYGPFVSPAPTPPPPAPPPAAVITPPSITAASKTIGVVMTRVVGTYSAGWTAVAGRWTIDGTETELSTAATSPSDSIPEGGYALYRETIDHATEADQYAYSTPYGPFIAAAQSDAIITPPAITAANKNIGTVMTRVIGTYASGWTPVAGEWTINGTTTVIGTQATCASDSIPVGGYALYKETINHATLPAEEAFSLPFGPFVEAPTPPPGPPPAPPPSGAFSSQMTAMNEAQPVTLIALGTGFNGGNSTFKWCGGYVENEGGGTPSYINLWYELNPEDQSGGQSLGTYNYAAAPNTTVDFARFKVWRKRGSDPWVIIARRDGISGLDFWNYHHKNGYDINGYTVGVRLTGFQSTGNFVKLSDTVTTEITGGVTTPIDVFRHSTHPVWHEAAVGYTAYQAGDWIAVTVQIRKRLINPFGTNDMANVKLVAHLGSDKGTPSRTGEYMHSSYVRVPDDGSTLVLRMANITVNKSCSTCSAAGGQCYNYPGVMSAAQLDADPPPYVIEW